MNCFCRRRTLNFERSETVFFSVSHNYMFLESHVVIGALDGKNFLSVVVAERMV